MRTRNDIEAFLARSGHPNKEVADHTWLVTDASDDRDHIVVRLTEDLVIFRMKIIQIDRVEAKNREPFFALLLRLNAEDMVHGAYGLTDGDVVVTATLRLENLDFNEFSGTLDDFALAVSNHYPQLREFVAAAA